MWEIHGAYRQRVRHRTAKRRWRSQRERYSVRDTKHGKDTRKAEKGARTGKI
jgi:hypothetical protein